MKAVVRNRDYADGTFGTLALSARMATKPPESNDHWLPAKVHMKSGDVIKCSEPRSIVWDDFGA